MQRTRGGIDENSLRAFTLSIAKGTSLCLGAGPRAVPGRGVRLARHRDARRPREDELEQALGLADEDGAVEAGGALRYLRAALALEGDVRPALEGYLGHGCGEAFFVSVFCVSVVAPRRATAARGVRRFSNSPDLKF